MGDFLSSFGDVRFVSWLVVTLFAYGFCYWRYQKHVQVKVNEITAQVIAEHRDNPLTKATDIDAETQRRTKESVFFAVIKYSIIVAVFTVVTTYLFFFSFRLPISSSPEHWGQMGDFFGGMLNPILAFASFIALLYTIRIQSEELRLTREEFAKSVAEQSKIATSQQAGALAQAQMVETYGSMIKSQEAAHDFNLCITPLREKIRLINDILFYVDVHHSSPKSLFNMLQRAIKDTRRASKDSVLIFSELSADFCRMVELRRNPAQDARIDRILRELGVADYLLGKLIELNASDTALGTLHAELGMPAAVCEMLEGYGVEVPKWNHIVTDFYFNSERIKKSHPC